VLGPQDLCGFLSTSAVVTEVILVLLYDFGNGNTSDDPVSVLVLPDVFIGPCTVIAMPVAGRKNVRRTYRRRRPNLRALVRRQINRVVETKELTLFSQAPSIIGSLTGTLVNLTSISQGSGNTSRVGNVCRLTKLAGRLVFNMEPNVAVNMTCCIRMLIVQSRGRELFVGDMPQFYGPCDLDLMYVYKDALFQVENTSYSPPDRLGSTMVTKSINLRKFRSPVMHYDDTSTVARNGPIYIYFLAENGGGAVGGYIKTYFKDA